MFNFFRKIKNHGKKKVAKYEKHVKNVMEATGWDRAYTIGQMKEAKSRLGISYGDYNRNAFYNIPIEEQKAKYDEILKRKEQWELKKEKYITNIMGATGWSREYTITQLKDAKSRLGISYGDYNRNAFYNIPIEEQKAKYETILKKKEDKRKRIERNNEKAIKGVMEATGWDYNYTKTKISEANKRTGCTYNEYRIYRFYELTPEEQDDIFVINLSQKITAKYDVNKQFNKILCNKELTNVFFSKYLRRPWCVNTKITLEEFGKIFSRSNRIIYKPLGGHHGDGVKTFDISSDNVETVFNTISSYPEGVVEQYIVQHPKINSINSGAVNTLRLVTISSNTQQVTEDGARKDIVYAAFKIGGIGSVVDNLANGGMVAAVDLKTGKLITDATDEKGNVFKEHPVTGIAIKDFEIPFFKEALELVSEAIDEKQIEGYLGWDIAITESGPDIIEVNVVPGVILLTMPYIAEKKGMKHLMEKYV